MAINDECIKNKKNCARLSIEEKEYIQSRFNDSESNAESIYRIKHNIEIRPVCPICGEKLKFTSHGFQKTCLNKECIQINKNIIRKQTCLERYGVENVYNIPAIKEKCKNENVLNKEIHNEKRKQTCLERYGVDNVAKSNQIKKIYKQTCLEKYGVENFYQSSVFKEKSKQTCLERYGVEYITQTEEHINNFKSKWKDIKKKIYCTKKKNNSFTKSNPEDTCYNLLCKVFNTVKRQYKSEKYPFLCDFYIPEIDTYIEYQGFWTHGKKPFEGTKEDIKILNIWKEKTSSFYKGAIINWTINDVKKRTIAKENNLNFIELWSIKDLKEFLLTYA